MPSKKVLLSCSIIIIAVLAVGLGLYSYGYIPSVTIEAPQIPDAPNMTHWKTYTTTGDTEYTIPAYTFKYPANWFVGGKSHWLCIGPKSFRNVKADSIAGNTPECPIFISAYPSTETLEQIQSRTKSRYDGQEKFIEKDVIINGAPAKRKIIYKGLPGNDIANDPSSDYADIISYVTNGTFYQISANAYGSQSKPELSAILSGIITSFKFTK